MTDKKQVVFDYEPESFSIIANPIIDDKNITPAALSLYVIIRRWITFRAEGFVCSKAFIASKFNAGERMFSRAWDELKDAGYLKMYSHPTEGWRAKLLSTAQPDVPHTFYLDLSGEVKSTNIDRAQKKAAKEEESEKQAETGGEIVPEDHYPQNVHNGQGHYLQNVPNGDHYLQNDYNGNVGNNINTLNKNSFNIISDNQSINHKEEEPENKKIDRSIDKELINDIKDQIDYDYLTQSIAPDELEIVVSALAEMYTATEPQIFGGRSYAPELVRERSLAVGSEHVEYVFECFRDQREKVYNIKKYLATAVFNSVDTLGTYMANKVRSDGMIL